ncbi:hypothetical protein D1B31_06375 [Neobacillus notoginsengisoli]|uniref:Uncharacterized protein n=1 Tax=Neobacillus notoginsengisoli TaxID=1578198 RepID=A0A417YXB4_9BACI|nr:hypothetical protein [Neobacillus notoginsengisoli]RHW42247.1 hypothetical protein D1B31_06375 [Neobacillus notoginsengisoli]
MNDLQDKYYRNLLDEYRKIWNHRLLAVPKGKSSEFALKEAIRRELLDENSHPRTRKDVFTKFYQAVKRIAESEISSEAKVQLINLHTEKMEQLI